MTIYLEIKEFMFEEGGLELTGKYKCVNLTYDAAFRPEANDYLPTPASFVIPMLLMKIKFLELLISINGAYNFIWTTMFLDLCTKNSA